VTFKSHLILPDGKEGVFDGKAILQRNGWLLEPLRSDNYFKGLLIDSGALCWANGLEFSPA
jgi:hypothetical protein